MKMRETQKETWENMKTRHGYWLQRDEYNDACSKTNKDIGANGNDSLARRVEEM